MYINIFIPLEFHFVKGVIMQSPTNLKSRLMFSHSVNIYWAPIVLVIAKCLIDWRIK